MSFISQITNEKTFNLFIGNLAAAKNEKLLKEYDIGFIINISDVSNETKIPSCSLSMAGAFHATIIEKITEMIKNYNVFIHCEDGKTRAPTIAILWINSKYGKSINESYLIVKAVHSETVISKYILNQLNHAYPIKDSNC